MSVRPVFPGSPEASGPRPDAASWVVQPGETLSGIARQLQGPGVPGTPAERSRPDGDLIPIAGRTLRCGAETLRMHVDEQRARLENALLRWIHRVPAEPVPAPPPAEAPRFRQSDPAWRSQRLGVAGDGPTLPQAGCAVPACAMALSRIGGTVLPPDALLRHLRASGGFHGPLLDWSAAGSAIAGRPHASPGDLDCAQLDRELDAGKPVLLRVVHDVQGRSRQH